MPKSPHNSADLLKGALALSANAPAVAKKIRELAEAEMRSKGELPSISNGEDSLFELPPWNPATASAEELHEMANRVRSSHEESASYFRKLAREVEAATKNGSPPKDSDLGAQGDLFVLELLDASLQGVKSDNDSAEAPYFALSTNDLKPYQWQSQDGNLIVRIVPPQELSAEEERAAAHRLEELGRDGKKALPRATIHDKDILIYLATQLVLSLDAGQQLPTDRRVHFVAYDLLKAIKRHTNKNAYQLLKHALERLTRTYIFREKRLPNGQWQSQEGFALVSNWRAIRNTTDDRMSHIEVELAVPFAAALNARHVVSLHRTYFDLKPLAKAIYGIAAKHCGRQAKWPIGLEALRGKAGFRRDIYEFKTELLALATELPGYLIEIDTSKSVADGKVTFYNREKPAAALVLPKMNQVKRKRRTPKQ